MDSTGNVSVSGGALHLTLRREKSPVLCPGLPEGVSPLTSYTSGMVTTTGKFAQAYGRFEFRARFPTTDGPGLHGALWLWPEDESRYGGRPAAGEIDVAEYYTQYPDRVVPYLHFDEAVAGQRVTNTDCFVERPDQFHTYSLEWTPETMTIAYDGRVCLQTTWQATGLVRPAPFDVPFFLNLTQALGRGTNAPGDDLELPATLDVDYVRVWS
jgi:beta-glucanase (GH16 family)